MEMEYLYEQGGEPPRSPPPPYHSVPRQTPPSRPQTLRAPRRKPEVAVYIPSGAPPKYSCEMSVDAQAPATTSRRSSVCSEATLADAADQSNPAAARIDKADDFDPSTSNCYPTSTTTILEETNSSILDAEMAVATHYPTSEEENSSGQSPALAVSVRRYEVSLNAHKAMILAWRTANRTLERQLLRSRDLEISAAELTKVVEAKDRRIVKQYAHIKALEEKIRRQEEKREENEERDGGTEHEAGENLVQAEDREAPAVEEQSYSATWEVVGMTLRIAGVLMIVMAVFMFLGVAMLGPVVEARRQ